MRDGTSQPGGDWDVVSNKLKDVRPTPWHLRAVTPRQGRGREGRNRVSRDPLAQLSEQLGLVEA